MECLMGSLQEVNIQVLLNVDCMRDDGMIVKLLKGLENLNI